MKLDKLFVMAGALSCALGMSGAALGAEEAIVRNGGFEAGGDGKVAGWREQGKYAFRAGEGVNGTGAFYYENDNPKYYGVPGQKIHLAPGKRYRFSVWIRT